MPNQKPLERVAGVIESANATGVRIGGQWYSVSKFRPVDLPAVGSTVLLMVDEKRWIDSVLLAAGAPMSQAAALSGTGQTSDALQSAARSENGMPLSSDTLTAPWPWPLAQSPAGLSPEQRDRRITRMAALNTAVAFVKEFGPADLETLGHAYEVVIEYAASFEAWVTR